MLPALPHVALLACNALLDREPWAREALRVHAEKTVALQMASTHVTWQIQTTGHLTRVPDSVAPSVQVRLADGGLAMLLYARGSARLQVIHLDGEAALAKTLADLAQNLRWDAEDDLARWFGDIPARHLMAAGRSVLAVVQRAGQHLAQNLAEFATHESSALPRRAEFLDWRDQITQVDQRSQQLLQRVSALSPPLPPSA